MNRLSLTALLVLTALLPAISQAGEVTLTGSIDHSRQASYLELPFDVPAGTKRISVAFEYPRDAGVTIDLGIIDPQRLRGWSGGNKSRFTLSETDATPSYLPGPIPAGTWKLLLGIPRADPGAQVTYQATVSLASGTDAYSRAFASQPLKNGPGWYRGDLHLHTGHSDGHCPAPADGDIPCPLWQTVSTAASRGLDFIAITEHNTRSHFNGMRAIQPYFQHLLLVPGQEITTFHGHANLLGSTGPFDFRLTTPDATPLVRGLATSGGILSINHPGLPSGAQCMGCGWTAEIDPEAITAVEIVNGGQLKATGGRVHTPISGIPFWEGLLARGRRVTAVAGSDNHDPTLPAGTTGAIGSPTTVIHAANLSQSALLDGLRAGRAFIDVVGTYTDTILALRASAGGQHTSMGGNLIIGDGESLALEVTTTHLPDAEIHAWYRQAPLSSPAVTRRRDGTLTVTFTLNPDDKPGWLRAEVRSADGDILLLSNPVYLNLPD